MSKFKLLNEGGHFLIGSFMNKKLRLEELGRKSLEEYKLSVKFPIILVLDDVRSHHNVGSAFRTADAFNVEEIVLCGISPCPPHREIRKTALGASESVKWSHQKSALDFVLDKKSKGWKIVSVEQCSQSISLESFKVEPEPSLIILGNEVEGVSQELIDISDVCLEIPQFGTKHSLNVSVALGVSVWEIAKGFMP